MSEWVSECKLFSQCVIVCVCVYARTNVMTLHVQMCVRWTCMYCMCTVRRVDEFSIEEMLLFITSCCLLSDFDSYLIDRTDLQCLPCITVIEWLPWCLHMYTSAIRTNDCNFILFYRCERKVSNQIVLWFHIANAIVATPTCFKTTER